MTCETKVERNIDYTYLYDIEATIIVSPDAAGQMVKDRDILLQLINKRFRQSMYNMKVTALINLTFYGITCLDIGWLNRYAYARQLFYLVLETPNTESQNAYDVSASFYLAKSRNFAINEPLSLIANNYCSDVIRFKPLPTSFS